VVLRHPPRNGLTSMYLGMSLDERVQVFLDNPSKLHSSVGFHQFESRRRERV